MQMFYKRTDFSTFRLRSDRYRLMHLHESRPAARNMPFRVLLFAALTFLVAFSAAGSASAHLGHPSAPVLSQAADRNLQTQRSGSELNEAAVRFMLDEMKQHPLGSIASCCGNAVCHTGNLAFAQICEKSYELWTPRFPLASERRAGLSPDLTLKPPKA
jgi:hypothetical protein